MRKRRKRQTTGRRGELLLGYTVGWASRRVDEEQPHPAGRLYHACTCVHDASRCEPCRAAYTVESSRYFTPSSSPLFFQQQIRIGNVDDSSWLYLFFLNLFISWCHSAANLNRRFVQYRDRNQGYSISAFTFTHSTAAFIQSDVQGASCCWRS